MYPPASDPTKSFLYRRESREPYRNDDDLVYENVDDSLVDLINKMLVKNPEKRIRLRDVKRHPWVTQGLTNTVGWIDDTDPSQQTAGRKIQVDDKEIGGAVVPLTLLQRARSAMKKAVDKVMYARGDRAESASRRRAASSAASSAGDSPSNYPSTPHPRDARRKSLRGDDYLATITQMPTELMLTRSVTASPSESPRESVLRHRSPPPPPPPATAAATATTAPTAATASTATAANNRKRAARAARLGPLTKTHSDTLLQDLHPASSPKTLSRHGHAQSLSNSYLSLTPALHTPYTVPATPAAPGRPEDAIETLRERREVRTAAGDDPSRSRSMDRAGLVFPSVDKRADAMVGLSTAIAAGNVHVTETSPARCGPSTSVGRPTPPRFPLRISSLGLPLSRLISTGSQSPTQTSTRGSAPQSN